MLILGTRSYSTPQNLPERVTQPATPYAQFRCDLQRGRHLSHSDGDIHIDGDMAGSDIHVGHSKPHQK